MTDLVWRSLHVHRYGRQDEFLVRGLAPVLAGLRESGGLAGSFFLRYWQGGHHVRVRLRLPAPTADDQVRAVAERIRAHLAAHPVDDTFDAQEFSREAQPTMAALESTSPEPVHPPDTVRAAAYEPEYGKYGGPAGVAVAEAFFDRSSAIALSALSDLTARPAKRLGTAFSTMVRGLRAAGRTRERMADFFAHYCLLWSPYVFDPFLDTWPELLRERRAAVGAHTEALLGHSGDDPFTAAIRAAWSRVDRTAPEVTLLGRDAPREHRERVLLVSYLHTHNNRLGLIPEQEAFLGYLGHHVLAGPGADPDLMTKIRDTRAARLGEMATR